MKAAYLEKFGDSSVIQIGELPMPILHENEVLVKIKAVTVNPVDTFIRKGSYPITHSFPYVISRDAIGIVEEIGEKVTQFKKGMRVFTFSMGYEERNGVASEYAAVPENRLVEIPKEVPVEKELNLLASLHPAATASILLEKTKKGQSVLVTGAAGHVGKALVTLANLRDLKVSTTSKKEDFSLLKNLGAKSTYFYGENFQEQIKETFDFVVDTSGQVFLETQVDLLKPKGEVWLVTTPKEKGTLNYQKFYQNSQTIKGFVISKASLNELQFASRVLNEAFKKRKLLEENYLCYPIEKAAFCQFNLENKLEKSRFILQINS